MKVSESRIVDPAIIAEISTMLHSGSGHEASLRKMRDLGLDKIECIKLLREHGGVTLGQAKDIVHLSPAWADRYDSDEAFHDVAESALTLVLDEEKRSAA